MSHSVGLYLALHYYSIQLFKVSRESKMNVKLIVEI